MTTMTLSQAIQQAIADHGNEAVWSDGGTDWTLDNYLDATIEAHDSDDDHNDAAEGETCGCALFENEPVSYDGRTIRRIKSDGYIDTGEAMLRLKPFRVEVACDTPEAAQFVAWLREQGHEAWIGSTTATIVNDHRDIETSNRLWDAYCAS